MGIFNIRLIEKEDLPFITEIRNDEETKKYLGTFVLLSKYKQEQWFEKIINDNTKMYLIFEKNKQPIGYVRITDIDYLNKSMCVGGDIHKKHRGKGYSQEMYNLIFDLGFKQLNMNRLWLFVLEQNERALYVYKKYGFLETGKARQAVYKNGKYHDYVSMDILKSEYDEMRKNNA